MTSIKVAVRVRPLSDEEKRVNCKICLQVRGNSVVVTDYKVPEHPKLDHRLRVRTFAFDYCFWSVDPNDRNYASQQMVYDELGTAVLEALLQGYNVCVFSYGQTGSGKTFTMMGKPEQLGMTPRICQGLFTRISNQESNNAAVSYQVDVSFMEIYNEKVYDLLQPPGTFGSKSRLRVREHPIQGPFVEGLTSIAVNDVGALMRLVAQGNENRSLAATQVNERSSRSHAIFTISVTQAYLDQERPTEVVSKLHLVDLAGSEKANPEFCQARIKEGGNINKSLVTLGNVISALAESTKGGSRRNSNCTRTTHIPYRDSLLTWLLRDSLGGNALTFMVATVSPSYLCISETLNTLRYAERTKKVLNTPLVNEDPRTKLICNLKDEVVRLKNLIARSQLKIAFGPCDVDLLSDIVKQNEEKIEKWTQSWMEKWCGESFSTESAVVKDMASWDDSAFHGESSWPYLLYWDSDKPQLGTTLYALQEGCIDIGSSIFSMSTNFIELRNQDILPKHCSITTDKGNTFLEPITGSLCRVNGVQVTDTVTLRHGDTIVLGQTCVLSFNHLFITASPSPDLVPINDKEISDALTDESDESLLKKEHYNEEMSTMAYCKEYKDLKQSCKEQNNSDNDIGVVNGEAERNDKVDEKPKFSFWKEFAEEISNISKWMSSNGISESRKSTDFSNGLHDCESLYLLDEALLNSSFGSIATLNSQNDLNDAGTLKILPDVQQQSTDNKMLIADMSTSKVAKDKLEEVNHSVTSRVSSESNSERSESDRLKIEQLFLKNDSLKEMKLGNETFNFGESSTRTEMQFARTLDSKSHHRSVSMPIMKTGYFLERNDEPLKYSASFPCYEGKKYLDNSKLNQDKLLNLDHSKMGQEEDFQAWRMPCKHDNPPTRDAKDTPAITDILGDVDCTKVKALNTLEKIAEGTETDSTENNEDSGVFVNTPIKCASSNSSQNIADSLEMFEDISSQENILDYDALSQTKNDDNRNSAKEPCHLSVFHNVECCDDLLKRFEPLHPSLNQNSCNNADEALPFLSNENQQYDDKSLGKMDMSIDSIEPTFEADSLNDNSLVVDDKSNEVSGYKSNIDNQCGSFYLEIAHGSVSNATSTLNTATTSWSLLSQNAKNTAVTKCLPNEHDNLGTEPLDSLEIVSEQERNGGVSSREESPLSRSTHEYNFFPYRNKEGKPVAGVLWKTDCLPGDESISATIPLFYSDLDRGNREKKQNEEQFSSFLSEEGGISAFQKPQAPSASTESIDSSTSSDSITYVFVGPTNAAAVDERNSKPLKYDINAINSQNEDSTSNYATEDYNISRRRSTFCSLSADSLDFRGGEKTKLTAFGTSSPRTLSVDTLVMEEGLSKLKEEDLSKFLEEVAKSKRQAKTHKTKSKSGVPSGSKEGAERKQCKETTLTEAVDRTHKSKELFSYLEKNRVGMDLKSGKSRGYSKFGSAHSDPFPGLVNYNYSKKDGLYPKDSLVKNRSYPCHSTPKGGSLHLNEIDHQRTDHQMENCNSNTSEHKRISSRSVSRHDVATSNTGLLNRSLATSPSFNTQSSRSSSERELDCRIIELLGDVVNIVGRIASKNTSGSVSESLKSTKEQIAGIHSLAQHCSVNGNSAANSGPCQRRSESKLPSCDREMLDNYELPRHGSRSSHLNAVSSMLEEVEKLRKERMSFAHLLSHSKSEVPQDSSAGLQGLSLRKKTRHQRTMDKYCKNTDVKLCSQELSQRSVTHQGGHAGHDTSFCATPQRPRSYLQHLVNIRRNAVEASSSLWKGSETKAEGSTSSDFESLNNSRRIPNYRHHAWDNRSSTRHISASRNSHYRWKHYSTSEEDSSLSSSSSLTSAERSCSLNHDNRHQLASLSSSWNSMRLIDETSSDQKNLRTEEKNSSKQKMNLLWQMSTDSGACCSSSPVSTTKEGAEFDIKDVTLALSGQARRSWSSHSMTHGEGKKVSEESNHYIHSFQREDGLPAGHASTISGFSALLKGSSVSDLDKNDCQKQLSYQPHQLNQVACNQGCFAVPSFGERYPYNQDATFTKRSCFQEAGHHISAKCAAKSSYSVPKQRRYSLGLSDNSSEDEWFPRDSYRHLPNYFSKDNCRHLIVPR